MPRVIILAVLVATLSALFSEGTPTRLAHPPVASASGQHVVLGDTRVEPDNPLTGNDFKYVWGGYVAASSASVDTVWLRLSVAGVNPPPTVLCKAVVYEDDGTGHPGALRIVSAEVPVSGVSPTWVRFSVSPAVTLVPGRKYYVGVHTPSVLLKVSETSSPDPGISAFGNGDTYSDGPSDPFGSASSISRQGSAYLTGPAGTVKATSDHQGGPADNLNTAFSKEPVNLDNGNFYHEHIDLSLPGRGPGLSFTRAYNSLNPVAGPLAYGWSFNYGVHLIIDRSNPAVTIVTRVSEGGAGATFVENPDGSYARPPGVFETLTENPDGTFVLTRTNQIKFNFEVTGRLTSIADRNNNSVTLTYDASGLKHATDSNSPSRHLDFTNDQGRISKIDDPQGGRYVTFTYDTNGDLWQVRDVKGGITYFTYQNHRLWTITDANSNPITTNYYDAAGRTVEQIDGEQNRTCIYYGQPPALSSVDCPAITPLPATNQTILVNPRLNKTTYTFDANFATTQIVDANTHTWAFSYEAPGAVCSPNIDGNLCSATDPLGHNTSFWYDGSGNVVTHTDALGNHTSLTYTALNDIASEQDPLGQKTEYGYDPAGNLTSVTRKDASGAQAAPPTIFGRDPSGNGDLVSITDGNGAGHTTAFSYDTNGLANLVTDPVGNITDYDYDSAGRLTCVKDAESNRTKYDYDEQNNVRFVHDAQNTAFVTDTCTPQAGSDNPTEYQYDAKGNRRFVINARGKTTQYVYDKMDRLKSVTDPLLRLTSFIYDPDGNLYKRTDARSPNRTVTYVYDPADRLTNINYPDMNLNVTYTYYDDGLRQTMTDSTGSTSYEYYANHQLKKVTYPGSIVVQYQYDAAGNRTRVTYPDATKYVSYTYDAFNRMKTVTPNWLGSVTTYQYDNAGNLDLTTTTTPGSATLTADPTWDQANRLTSLINKSGSMTLSSYSYTLLDKVGNRKTVVDFSGTTMYGYDKLYRLTDVTYPNNDIQHYTYDAVGNRLTKVQNSVTTSYLYDDADELTRSCPATTCTTSTPGTYYGYEGNGVLAQYGPNNNASDLSDVNDVHNTANQFLLEDYEGRYLRIGHCFDQYINGTFDGVVTTADVTNVNQAYNKDEGNTLYSPRKDLAPLGRPDGLLRTADSLAASSGYHSSCAGTAHFFYNGDGLRIQKWIGVDPNMRKTEYIWDVGSALPVELEERVKDSQGNLLATYDNIYGLGQIARTDNSGGVSYYLYDGLGSTTGLANNSGSATDTYTYDAFGATRSHSVVPPASPSGQPFLFTGQLQDTDTTGGLYYLRARYYDPSLGRFWTQDPLPSGNLFAYAANNPATLTDPSGLCVAAAPGAAVAVGAAPETGGTSIVVVGGGTAVVCVGAIIVATCVLGQTCDAWGGAVLDAGRSVVGGVEEIAGSIAGFFSGKKNRKDWVDQYNNNMAGANTVIDKIRKSPCDQARHHWETNLNGIIRKKINPAAAKIGLPPFVPDLPDCKEGKPF